MDKKEKPKRKRIEDLLENLLNQKKYVYEFTLSKPFNYDSNISDIIVNAIRDLETHGYNINSFCGLYTFKYETEVRFEESDRIAIGIEYFYIHCLKYDIFKRCFTAILSLSEK